MNVSLTPKLEKLVSEKVATGLYGSASEVVREALRLLEQREQMRQARLDQLRKDLDVGIAQLDLGARRPFDAKAAERIKTQGRKLLAGQRKRV